MPTLATPARITAARDTTSGVLLSEVVPPGWKGRH